MTREQNTLLLPPLFGFLCVMSRSPWKPERVGYTSADRAAGTGETNHSRETNLSEKTSPGEDA